MPQFYYPFKIKLSDYQREELLKIAKKISFQPLYGEGNYFSTNTNQVNSLIPSWIHKLFEFPFRRFIFLYNEGNVLPHRDIGRTSVITYPLNKVDVEISWWNCEYNGRILEKLNYGLDPYLINVDQVHSVFTNSKVDRYFLQLPLDGNWDENVKIFKDKNLLVL